MTTGTGLHEIDAAGLDHRTLNQMILQCAEGGAQEITIHNVLGQRYIGSNLRQPVRLIIHGTPGNDLAAFADGPQLVVHGNGQDGLCNTMNDGSVVVHGNAGDVLGYAMRGGRLFIRGDVGYRVGIHMKSYMGMSPTIIIGGRARDFLGEYLAGGTVIVLGLHCPEGVSPVGSWVGTGMHGGVIYLRGRVEPWQLGAEVAVTPLTDEDLAALREHLDEFAASLSLDLGAIHPEQFCRLSPHSARPYGKLYTP